MRKREETRTIMTIIMMVVMKEKRISSSKQMNSNINKSKERNTRFSGKTKESHTVTISWTVYGTFEVREALANENLVIGEWSK